MISRRLLLLNTLFIVTACKTTEKAKLGRLSIGVVSYEESAHSIQQYSDFTNYLSAVLKTFIELEPVFNEIKAIEQIKRKNWSLVVAPPGLAAIAISEEQYVPLFPLEDIQSTRALILVRQESPYKKLTDLANQAVAFGQPGSATGYYFPLYNLYGLTLAQVRIAPTPKTILQWIDKKDVAAGALSLAEFERYRLDFKKTKFRILFTGSVPPGAILVSPTIQRQQQDQIRKALELASPNVIASAGYIPTANPPNYQELIKVVKKVRAISEQIKQKPVNLYK